MEDNSFISKYVFGTLETFISQITTNSSWTDRILQIIIVVFFIFWIYTGLKLFFDSQERYKIGWVTKLLILIFAVITGPIGLLIYYFTRPKYTLEETEFIQTEHKFYYQNSSKVIECIKCNAYLLDGYMFCTECGEQNRLRCENCNVLTNLDDKFCYYCGNDFGNRKLELSNKLNEKINLLDDKSDANENESQRPLLIRKAYEGISAIKGTQPNIFNFSDNFKNSFRTAFTTSRVNLNNLHFKDKASLGNILDQGSVINEEPVSVIEPNISEFVEEPVASESNISNIKEAKKTKKKKVAKKKSRKKVS